jgi:hypothetical protein
MEFLNALVDWFYNDTSWAFFVSSWQAGFNMMPASAFNEYLEAWAETKGKE